ncbi:MULTISPECIES: accessory gene regulator B family protein [unclassified Enterococcus]|uniref:accessory gene regulator B family protein n=1 Tax=unclassified Enterococcus TaxID=2608891 RepID=UPI0013EC2855|nr:MULTISPECIES: accessory gene regulator B family protein [unclassified Enterococcus]
MPDEYISFEEKISKKISSKLGERGNFSELDTAKIEYGLSILLVDSIKLIFIYGAAILFNNVLAVFVTHIAFVILRMFTSSYHASNSVICTLQSIFLLVVLSFLAEHAGIAVSRGMFLLGALLICLILGVKDSFIAQSHSKQKGHVNRKLLLAGLSDTVIGIGIPNDHLRLMVLLGMSISTLLILIKKRKEWILDEKNGK